MQKVADFLGYKGAALAHRKNFPTIATVKTKLKDNKWLGARCVDENHKKQFRSCMAEEFGTFCEVKMAKKILRENDTQVNESYTLPRHA